MRTAALLAVVLLIASTASPISSRAEPPALPTPPRQAEPWSPPKTKLPRFFVSATAALFEQGLADPRGCEYRKIRIAIGTVWGGDPAEVAASGWVLPAADGGKTRHAVVWNGLVYPLIAADEPADLDADVLDQGEPGDERARGRMIGRGNDAASSVAVDSLDPVKICLLLRLGRADLAEAAWAERFGPLDVPRSNDPKPRLDLKSYGVSYLSLASDLAWHRFDRAVRAHMRGDDALALADARALEALGKGVEVKAQDMGFVRPAGRSRYIDFLEQAPALLADQERRARERAEPPPPPRGDGPEGRIAGLIRELDQVAVRQWGQPGAVVLGESPIVKKLIAEGDAAVQPLIQAFRSDDRLTRSVGFGRDFHRGRTILRVDQAVYAALTGILKTTNFGPAPADEPDGRLPSRKELADRIQAYWDKNRSIPLVDRWYRTLADDEAGSAAWLQAAAMITQPENVDSIFGAGAFTVTTTKRVKPGERPALKGEALRRGRVPTVAELMARRIETIRGTPDVKRSAEQDAEAMAKMLAAWRSAAGPDAPSD